MLPKCMFYEKFQVFGIHIYLQDPKQLLCPAISNVEQPKTTETPHRHTLAPPPRTFITELEEKKTKNINSENYAIEAYDFKSSGDVTYSKTHAFTIIFISILNLICLKYVIQR
jgi:hypothetical protein